MSEDYYSQRNSAARFLLQKLDDKGKQQYAKVDGLTDETFERVMRVQPHGFTSHPPAGSHMLGIALGGKRDTLALLGGEHPDKRHRNVGEGNTAIYNADGTIAKHVGKDYSVDAEGNMTFTSKTVKFKCGGVTVTISGDGVKVEGGKVQHDDKNIGKTHKHEDDGAGVPKPDV